MANSTATVDLAVLLAVRAVVSWSALLRDRTRSRGCV